MSEGPQSEDSPTEQLSDLWRRITGSRHGDPELHVLTESFRHLDAEHIHHNKVIHQTFYLSVVFFAAIVSVAADGLDNPWFVIGAGVLVLAVLGRSTKMYIRSREQVKRKKQQVIEELREFDLTFEAIDSVQDVTYTTVRGDPIDCDDRDRFEHEFEPTFPHKYKSELQIAYHYAIILVLVAIGFILHPGLQMAHYSAIIVALVAIGVVLRPL